MAIKHGSNSSLAQLLFLPTLFISFSTGVADPIDDARDLPATAEEAAFIDGIVEEVSAAVPSIDGWKMDLRTNVTGNTVREDERPLIYERARDFPLEVSMHFDFQWVTAEEQRAAGAQKTAADLQQEMMAAAMSGDMQKTEALQQELAALMQAEMTRGAMGQAVGAAAPRPVEKAPKFYVDVVVNGEGANIGKKFGITEPNAAKAFRIDTPDSGRTRYTYYLGAWDVSELDNSNWRIAPPADEQVAANHVRALTLTVSVSGDRDGVQHYVANVLDLQGLKKVVD